MPSPILLMLSEVEARTGGCAAPFFALLMAALLVLAASRAALAADALSLEAKIPLGEVAGRIDHMAVDLGRKRLFVAELGNDSLGIVDLEAKKLERRIAGLADPQGVDYEPQTDTVYVANARDGSVRLFASAALAPAGRIDLGEDADDIHVDAAAKRVFIGYGAGALAVIDAPTRRRVADIALKAHPEGFQLAFAGDRVFVNVPDAHEIAVVDRAVGRQIAAWTVPGADANFPMAFDAVASRVVTVFRSPPRLIALDAASGARRAEIATCGDADDVFVDDKRSRLYVSCGAGFLETFERRGESYASLGRIATVSGARTALYVPTLDRLYLAVRARGGEAAAIWVFRPVP